MITGTLTVETNYSSIRIPLTCIEIINACAHHMGFSEIDLAPDGTGGWTLSCKSENKSGRYRGKTKDDVCMELIKEFNARKTHGK